MSNVCQCCGKKISISKVFCSKNCKEEFFQSAAISIPKQFVKKLYFFCNESQRDEEIVKFSKRHNWSVEIVMKKVEELYNQHYYNKVAS